MLSTLMPSDKMGVVQTVVASFDLEAYRNETRRGCITIP